jgi:lipopolysaccharide cholinephosphotransferase
MLRSEYERFREACRTHLDHERFSFQDIDETEGYRWGYGKLRCNDSLFLREHQEHMPYHQGVFVDVFPLDPVPQSHLGRTVFNFRCFMVRKLLWSRVGKIADMSRVKRAVYGLLDLVPEGAAKACYRHLVRRAGRIKSDWVRILTFPTPNREWGYLRKWYATSEPASFEGVTFPGVSDADGYLTFKFGDWRSLPPVEQRKVHPVSAIRLPEEVHDDGRYSL